MLASTEYMFVVRENQIAWYRCIFIRSLVHGGSFQASIIVILNIWYSIQYTIFAVGNFLWRAWYLETPVARTPTNVNAKLQLHV